MAPQVGLEPTTLRLTAECSAIELLRNMKCGSDLLSRAVSSQVPSACWGLTSVFGMGTGGTPRPLPPQRVNLFIGRPGTLTTAYEPLNEIFHHFFSWSLDRLNQAIDRLVSSSYTHYCASTDDLSPGSLPGVSRIAAWNLILEVGFTLRCLQRLSHPHFASLLCRWHDNSCTSGASIPVLSY